MDASSTPSPHPPLSFHPPSSNSPGCCRIIVDAIALVFCAPERWHRQRGMMCVCVCVMCGHVLSLGCTVPNPTNPPGATILVSVTGVLAFFWSKWWSSWDGDGCSSAQASHAGTGHVGLSRGTGEGNHGSARDINRFLNPDPFLSCNHTHTETGPPARWTLNICRSEPVSGRRSGICQGPPCLCWCVFLFDRSGSDPDLPLSAGDDSTPGFSLLLGRPSTF